MKILKVIVIITVVFGVLALLYVGIRLVPGLVIFAMARDLALDAGCDGREAMAVAFLAGGIPFALLWWKGFSWRKLGLVFVLASLAFAAYFTAKAVLHNRAAVVSNPEAVHWFSNDGHALLFYARQPDGTLIFCSRPGFHYRTGQELKPVTAEIYQEWRRLKGLQDARAQENSALKEQLARTATEAAQSRRDLESQLKASEDRAREHVGLSERLARQKAEVQKAREEMETRLSATESNMQQVAALQQRTGERVAEAEQKKRDLENQVQLCTEKLSESATLSEELKRQKAEAEKAKKELERRLQAPQERTRQEAATGTRSGELLRQELGGKVGGGTAGPQTRGKQWGKRASGARNASTGTMSAVVIQIMNQTRLTACLTFSAEKCQHVWPDPGRAFVVRPGETVSISLGGYPGERIFFTGWAAENPSVQWGRCACTSGNETKPIAVCGAVADASVALVERGLARTRVAW